MLRFYGLRVLKDYLGHIILIGLPLALLTINTYISVENGAVQEEAALYIGLVYIFMFQVFGAAYTFEGMEHDFYKPFKNRLFAAPIRPTKFILANLFFSTLVSFLQSLVILSYVVIVFGVRIPNWGLILVVFLFSVMFAQLLAAVLIIFLKKANKAQAAITLYAIGGTMLSGLFFQLPENSLTEILEKYSTPIAWAFTSSNAWIEGNFEQGIQFLGMLVGITILAGLFLIKLTKRVV